MMTSSVHYLQSVLVSLPFNVWDSILSFLTNSSLQFTLRSLYNVFPTGLKISLFHRFKHIVINQNSHLKSLERLLSKSPNRLLDRDQEDDLDITSLKTNRSFRRTNLGHFTRTLTIRSWCLSPNVQLANLIRLVSTNLEAIELRIGPSFNPDSLQHLLWNPLLKLEVLSLKFNRNGCVERESYPDSTNDEQGEPYFDKAIGLLTLRWPRSSIFHSLSLIQVPPPLDTILSKEEMIFSHLACLNSFAGSKLGEKLINLRLRLPQQNLVSCLTDNKRRGQKLGGLEMPFRFLPELRYLDLSTTSLTSVDKELAMILKTYPKLHHLVLDRTQLLMTGDEENSNEEIVLKMSTIIFTSTILRANEVTSLWYNFRQSVREENNRRKKRAGRRDAHQFKNRIIGIGIAMPEPEPINLKLSNPILQTSQEILLKSPGSCQSYLASDWSMVSRDECHENSAGIPHPDLDITNSPNLSEASQDQNWCIISETHLHPESPSELDQGSPTPHSPPKDMVSPQSQDPNGWTTVPLTRRHQPPSSAPYLPKLRIPAQSNKYRASPNSAPRSNHHLDPVLPLIKLPSEIIILPSPPVLKTFSCGVDLSSPTQGSIKKQWAQVFLRGWHEGLKTYEDVLNTKLVEYERLIKIWESELSNHQTTGSNFGKKFNTFIQSRPRLMSFVDQEVDQEGLRNQGLDHYVIKFLKALDLREVKVEEVRSSLQRLKLEEKAPIACWVADCASFGKVLRLGKKERLGGIDGDGDGNRWQRPESEHMIGCGHLVGRKM